MWDHAMGAGGQAVVRTLGTTGAARAGKARRKRRRWSVEEKTSIARESFASNETITAMAERHSIPRNRLSAWRGQLRRGELVAPPSAKAREAFVVFEVEERPSAVIEGRGVTVRLVGRSTRSGSPRLPLRWRGERHGLTIAWYFLQDSLGNSCDSPGRNLKPCVTRHRTRKNTLAFSTGWRGLSKTAPIGDYNPYLTRYTPIATIFLVRCSKIGCDADTGGSKNSRLD